MSCVMFCCVILDSGVILVLVIFRWGGVSWIVFSHFCVGVMFWVRSHELGSGSFVGCYVFGSVIWVMLSLVSCLGGCHFLEKTFWELCFVLWNLSFALFCIVVRNFWELLYFVFSIILALPIINILVIFYWAGVHILKCLLFYLWNNFGICL